jgi:hypothetical protein
MECPLYQNERDCFFRNLRETPAELQISVWTLYNLKCAIFIFIPVLDPSDPTTSPFIVQIAK